MSIQTPIDVISYPPKFYYDATLENYSVVLIGKAWLGKYETVQTDFPRYYLNSLIVCSGAVAISMLLVSLLPILWPALLLKGRKILLLLF